MQYKNTLQHSRVWPSGSPAARPDLAPASNWTSRGNCTVDCRLLYTTVHYSTLLYTTVQCSTTQCTIGKYCNMQSSTVLYNIVQYSKNSMVHTNKEHYSSIQYNVVKSSRGNCPQNFPPALASPPAHAPAPAPAPSPHLLLPGLLLQLVLYMGSHLSLPSSVPSIGSHATVFLQFPPAVEKFCCLQGPAGSRPGQPRLVTGS